MLNLSPVGAEQDLPARDPSFRSGMTVIKALAFYREAEIICHRQKDWPFTLWPIPAPMTARPSARI